MLVRVGLAGQHVVGLGLSPDLLLLSTEMEDLLRQCLALASLLLEHVLCVPQRKPGVEPEHGVERCLQRGLVHRCVIGDHERHHVLLPIPHVGTLHAHDAPQVLGQGHVEDLGLRIRLWVVRRGHQMAHS